MANVSILVGTLLRRAANKWRRTSALLKIAGCLLVAAALSALAAARALEERRSAAAERRLDAAYGAFKSGVRRMVAHLKEQESVASSVELVLKFASDELPGVKERLAVAMGMTSPQIRGIGLVADVRDRDGSLGAIRAFGVKEYAGIRWVDPRDDWAAPRRDSGLGAWDDSRWSVVDHLPGDGFIPAAALFKRPLDDGGRTVGMIFVAANLEWLREVLMETEAKGGEFVCCVSPDGKLFRTAGGAMTIDAVDTVAVDDGSLLRPVLAEFRSPGSERFAVARARHALDDLFEDFIVTDVVSTGWLAIMRRGVNPPPAEVSWLPPVVLLALAAAFYAIHASFPAPPPEEEGGAPAEKLFDLPLFENDFAAKARRAAKGRRGERRGARVESELRVARQIQFSLIPSRFPPYSEWREFDLHALLLPAREIGGDYYDFFMRDADRLVFAVGDVSGKGIPAALYMAVCRTAFRALAWQVQHPGELLTKLNEMLIRDSLSGMYVTMACCFVDLPSGVCQYALGGHPAPLLFRRAADRHEYVDAPRETLIGLKSGIAYPVGETRLGPGDAVLLYSDGVPDARGRDGGDFGYARLMESFSASAGLRTCRDLVDALDAALQEHAGDREQDDDITLLVYRHWGPGGQRSARDDAVRAPDPIVAEPRDAKGAAS